MTTEKKQTKERETIMTKYKKEDDQREEVKTDGDTDERKKTMWKK